MQIMSTSLRMSSPGAAAREARKENGIFEKNSGDLEIMMK